MNRFMKNGEVHVALTRVTEYIPVDDQKAELATFIMSRREECAQTNGHTGIEWTPLDFIEWLPSSTPNLHPEWIYGTEGENL